MSGSLGARRRSRRSTHVALHVETPGISIVLPHGDGQTPKSATHTRVWTWTSARERQEEECHQCRQARDQINKRKEIGRCVFFGFWFVCVSFSVCSRFVLPPSWSLDGAAAHRLSADTVVNGMGYDALVRVYQENPCIVDHLLKQVSETRRRTQSTKAPLILRFWRCPLGRTPYRP